MNRSQTHNLLEPGSWTLNLRPCTLDPGPWTLNLRPYTLDPEIWTLQKRELWHDAFSGISSDVRFLRQTALIGCQWDSFSERSEGFLVAKWIHVYTSPSTNWLKQNASNRTDFSDGKTFQGSADVPASVSSTVAFISFLKWQCQGLPRHSIQTLSGSLLLLSWTGQGLEGAPTLSLVVLRPSKVLKWTLEDFGSCHRSHELECSH